MIKRSDLKALGFGRGYLHSTERINQIVQGPDSDLLKFDEVICSYCNNSRTQPHDLAWAALSDHIRGLGSAFVPGRRIDLQEVFPSGIRDGVRDVQLYFIKLLGCKAGVNGPLDLSSFAAAILSGQSHSAVWLRICVFRSECEESAGQTEIIGSRSDVHEMVKWTYFVNPLAIQIIWGRPIHSLDVLRKDGYWHPSRVWRYLPVVDVPV
jgi:hypothetical protein